jgi:glycosyltransferase involved in cell wall biosynthesis
MQQPQISVIICSYNPDISLLMEVISAIDAQKNAPKIEVIVVDNNSSPAIEIPDEIDFKLCVPVVVTELRQGLAFARSFGILVSKAPLIVFVDDDNILNSNYLQECWRIHNSEPSLGTFSGKCIGRYSVPPNGLIAANIARYAIRDLGDNRLIGDGSTWTECEPIGAGLAVQRRVALAFSSLVEGAGGSFALGRNAASLASGEDSLFSRVSYALGLQVGYLPSLKLLHVIIASKLTYTYLFKLIRAQATSQMLLEYITEGRQIATKPAFFALFLMKRFASRIRHPGLREAITHLWWDIGYFDDTSVSDREGYLKLKLAFDCIASSEIE